MIRCITKPDKFKNLTLNKEYEAIEDGDAYVLTNDAGFKARYAKTYFRTVRGARAVAAEVVAAPAPPRPAPIPLLSVLEVNTTWNAARNRLTVSIILNRTTRAVELVCNGATNSCGITEVSNISLLKAEIRAMFAARVPHMTGTIEEFFSSVMHNVMDTLRTSIAGAFFTFSDQLRDEDSIMDALLDELANSWSQNLNPNSGNQIKIWVLFNNLPV